jgi:hypothetical protein
LKFKNSFPFAQACGGVPFFTFLLIGMLIVSTVRIFGFVWLQVWMDKGDGTTGTNETVVVLSNTTQVFKGFVSDNPDLWFYQLVYFLSVVALVLVGIIKGMIAAIQFLKGARRKDHAVPLN